MAIVAESSHRKAAQLSHRLMKLTALFPLVLLFVASAFGRLDETVAECQTRYGHPITLQYPLHHMGFSELKDDWLFFRKNDVTIAAHFYTGRVDQIIFCKGEDAADQFTAEEIDTLLAANSRGAKWAKQERRDSRYQGQWKTSRTLKEASEVKLAYAHLYNKSTVLSISTEEKLHRTSAELREAEAERKTKESGKLKGF